MNQESKINESSTLVSQSSRTGVWIALGVGGALLLIGIIVGTILLALHFAPSQRAATTEGGSNFVAQHQLVGRLMQTTPDKSSAHTVRFALMRMCLTA